MFVKHFKHYFFNCFLLFLPVMVWDLAFTRQLPAAYQANVFWENIPGFIYWGENICRTLLFILAFLMPLQIKTSLQKSGLIFYLAGLLFYFTSWLLLIYNPSDKWSHSLTGFMAPAFTPLLWLTGISLIGKNFYFGLPYGRWIFLLNALVFLLFHNIHTWIIYNRLFS